MLKKTISDIKSLKIQGAASIAEAALSALQDEAHKSKANSVKQFLKDMKKAEIALSRSRPTEPYMRNIMALTQEGIHHDNIRQAKEDLHHNIQRIKKEMGIWKTTIAQIGSKKIQKGANVFIHCHSTMVMAILKEAKKQGKKFTVYNTEARPLYQGRISANELAKEGIKVNHYVDSAARVAIKQSDIMLIGCDAITSEKVINKIGSEMFAEMAASYEIPVYVCTPSLKFDPLSLHGDIEPMEQRKPEEIWKAPKNVEIHNPAFEKINTNLIQGIITELGIYPHSSFIQEVKRHYPSLF